MLLSSTTLPLGLTPSTCSLYDANTCTCSGFPNVAAAQVIYPECINVILDSAASVVEATQEVFANAANVGKNTLHTICEIGTDCINRAVGQTTDNPESDRSLATLLAAKFPSFQAERLTAALAYATALLNSADPLPDLYEGLTRLAPLPHIFSLCTSAYLGRVISKSIHHKHSSASTSAPLTNALISSACTCFALACTLTLKNEFEQIAFIASNYSAVVIGILLQEYANTKTQGKI